MSVYFNFASDMGEGTIEVRDEGGGAFVVLTSEAGLRIDPEELGNLAEWATETCAEMDEWHRRAKAWGGEDGA